MRVLFLLWLTQISIIASAKFSETELYKAGVPHQNYNFLVLNLRKNDTIRFSDGSHFKIIKNLGSGGVTQIYQISEKEAIRIPLFKGRRHINENSDTITASWFIDITFRGYPVLKNAGVQMIDLIPGKYHPGEYIVVDLFKHELRLDRYIESFKKLTNPKIEQAFFEFVQSIAPFEFIDDFRLDQVHWNGQKWALLDWGELHYLNSEGIYGRHPLMNHLPYLPKRIQKIVTKAIRTKRFEIEFGKPWPRNLPIALMKSNLCLNALIDY